MASKLQEYRRMSEEAQRQLTGSLERWQSFLTITSRLYKYPYHEQVMIHAQRPDATACAEYEMWNNTRYVRRGSKGIALIDTRGDRDRLRYVFDVSDTGARENARNVNLWRLQAAHIPAVSHKYTDAYGKAQFVYAWKLVVTDKTPAGKRDDLSLREKAKEIRRDLDDGIDTIGKKMTVCQLYAKQNSHKKNVKIGGQKSRDYLMGILQNDPLGARSIDTVKPSDAKEWAIRMSEKGFAFQTIYNFKRSLRAASFTAIEDDYLRKNPFNFALDAAIEDDREPKQALTPQQTESLLEFARNDLTYKKYVDEITILLETGLRISEFCGLTAKLDFAGRMILVDHQLLRDAENGYYIETPKTKSGSREVPMTEEAHQAFRRILKNRGKAASLSIDGYSNFLFLKQDGMPKVAANVESAIKGLVKKYNKAHEDAPLPKVTPHIFRHTFCTNMANQGMNPKTLQYIMGHANITMTLNYYAHADGNSVKAEMERIEKLRAEVQQVEQKGSEGKAA